jgi:hypothetical protein
MNDVTKISWAEVLNNGDFICVETFSGLGMMGRDPQGARHFLPSNVSDEIFGAAVLDALAQSRILTLGEAGIFFDLELGKQRYAQWVADLMARYGYKTKRSVFKNMKRCSVERKNGTIIIRPSHHEKLEAWSGDGISKEDYVTLSADSSTVEVGAALRLAFSRCT